MPAETSTILKKNVADVIGPFWKSIWIASEGETMNILFTICPAVL